jgi:hypothetical protein
VLEPCEAKVSRTVLRGLGLREGARLLGEARIRDGVRAVTMFWRAFDKTVSRKPLASAVDAVYGNSIDLGLEVITQKALAGKAWLLMLVNVLLPAFIPEWYTRRKRKKPRFRE